MSYHTDAGEQTQQNIGDPDTIAAVVSVRAGKKIEVTINPPVGEATEGQLAFMVLTGAKEV